MQYCNIQIFDSRENLTKLNPYIRPGAAKPGLSWHWYFYDTSVKTVSENFPNGRRPMSGGLRAVYHLPQQFLLAGANLKWEWPYRAANESYKMRFHIAFIFCIPTIDRSTNKCTLYKNVGLYRPPETKSYFMQYCN